MNPAPVGIPGELFIGGKGLARGYLKRPDLTAEKFVAHPFREGIAVRVYRTGDLARYLSDGNIEFIGRLDNQIKLRGFRIELGEIESALEKHPQVREAVSVVRNDANGYEQLVAFVLPQGSTNPAESDLLHALRDQLPAYLVPLRVLIVDEFPLTPNGKIDREALPGLNDSSVELTSIHKKPRTQMEKALVSIWLEVLNVDDIGVDDNFFELGGHSLIATQVISRIRDRLGVELPLIKLFEYPTIAGLACVAEEVQQLDEPLVV
ncbi:MAG: AMP-binding protein [Gammaproteobacteria bacterium]